MTKKTPAIVIIGAGPAGLGAAWRLQELGHENWRLVEAADFPGGLASSVTDERGFTWDLGGHVLFSQYEYFDRLMDELMGGSWVEHERSAWVWMRGRFIPYPLQNNIRQLPKDDMDACLAGLKEAHAERGEGEPPRTFHGWMLRNFGRGLTDVFLLPYNRKVWAYDPATLGVGWVGDRVAPPDVPRIIRNVELGRDDSSWGPNARFRFPLRGGTGAIWRALCARLPSERVRLGVRAVEVVARDRSVRLSDGGELRYDRLVSTMPLARLLVGLVDRPELATATERLRYSSMHVVGVGFEGSVPEALAEKSWIYFPEPDVPFHRVTVFSNYSPHNVPQPGRQWSLLCEVSESPEKPVDGGRIADEVVEALGRTGLVREGTDTASVWHRRIEHAYPTPTVGRDAVLGPVDDELRRLGIWSRGRFGGWKYEVANQDHSLMQGVEAIDHILFGDEEVTYSCGPPTGPGKAPAPSPRDRHAYSGGRILNHEKE